MHWELVSSQPIEEELKSTHRATYKFVSLIDAIGCLRYNFFRKFKVGEVTEGNEVSSMAGSGVHHGFKRVFISVNEEKIFHGIHARIDGRTKHDGKIVELKTTNLSYLTRPYDDHLEQLSAYLAIWKEKDGYIIYVKKDGVKREERDRIITTFHVELTDQDIYRIRKRLKKNIDLVQKALEPGNYNPAVLPKLYKKFRPKKCPRCFYRKLCEELDEAIRTGKVLEFNKKYFSE